MENTRKGLYEGNLMYDSHVKYLQVILGFSICFLVMFFACEQLQSNYIAKAFKELAIGYLSGVLVFYLTVVLRTKIARNRRFWELYDFYNELNTLAGIHFNERRSAIDENCFRETYTKEFKEKFESELTKMLRETIYFESIMTEEESILVGEIWKCKDIDVPNDEMDEKQIRFHYERLQRVLSNIEKLVSLINKEVRNH